MDGGCVSFFPLSRSIDGLSRTIDTILDVAYGCCFGNTYRCERTALVRLFVRFFYFCVSRLPFISLLPLEEELLVLVFVVVPLAYCDCSEDVDCRSD